MSNIKNYFAIASALLLVTTILVANPISLAAAQQPSNTTGASQPNINVEQKITEIRNYTEQAVSLCGRSLSAFYPFRKYQ